MQSRIMALGFLASALALSCTRSEAAPPPPPSPPVPSAIAPVALASAAPAPTAEAATPGPFDARLLDAARAYAAWPKITSSVGWASTDCAAPGPPPILHASTSRDDATHGQKLFHLFAHDNTAYTRDYKKPAPVGQVLVKEAWKPVLVLPDDQTTPRLDRAVHDGKAYRKGERLGLFLMLKVGDKVAGTDHGWIYGVVSGDGARVLAAGKLDKCIGCHTNAPGDRLFGPPS